MRVASSLRRPELPAAAKYSESTALPRYVRQTQNYPGLLREREASRALYILYAQIRTCNTSRGASPGGASVDGDERFRYVRSGSESRQLRNFGSMCKGSLGGRTRAAPYRAPSSDVLGGATALHALDGCVVKNCVRLVDRRSLRSIGDGCNGMRAVSFFETISVCKARRLQMTPWFDSAALHADRRLGTR